MFPGMMRIRDGERWEERLMGAMAQAIELETDATVDAGLRVASQLEVESYSLSRPTDFFFASILTGRTERSRRRCPHALSISEPILIRTHAWWLLACQICATEDLLDGQDTRCDWCGQDRPDMIPTITFRLGRLSLIGQFCLVHHAFLLNS